MTTPAIPKRGMSKAEVAQLLTLMASWDQRTIGEADVEAWYQVARTADWALPYAQRAVIEHHATELDRLQPAHITRKIRERRAHFTSTYEHKPLPECMTDVAEQVAYEREQVCQHVTACMARWARGEDL